MMIFAYPKVLLLILPVFIALLILLRMDFVRLDPDLKANNAFMKSRRIMKTFMFLTRFLIAILIIILFAKPYLEVETSESGSPRVTVLIDNSSSMSMFDTGFVERLLKEIDAEVPVTKRYITQDRLSSDVGEETARYLEQDGNVLLISDMQATEGMGLGDAASFAKSLNATISAISLKSEKKDASVSIDGDAKGVINQEMVFTVKVNKLNMEDYNIVVSIDDQPIFSARESKESIEIRKKFDTSGTHKITAKILGDDDVAPNNVFYKSVDIVKNPKILYVTETGSRLPDILEQVYDIDREARIPKNLSQYYAVIIEDMSTGQISNIDELTKFVQDGNGLLVIGGMNSYDRGGYKSSLFEMLLPVRIGRGEKKQGDSNIVILIDMSGSTQSYSRLDANGNLIEIQDTKPLDIIKALAVDVINTLNRGNKVGVIAFAIQDPNSLNETKFGAVKITDIEPLSSIIEMATDKIQRISRQGQSLFDVGFSGAYSMLKGETGSRNIILLSDGGKDIYQRVKDAALNNVQVMANEGIKTYTVGVGRDVDDAYLRRVAEAGNGLYFPATESNRLKILFGTPEVKQQGDEMYLFILNPTHFITRDLKIDAKVYGFNQVVPKSIARVIVTTDNGEPALTEWRYGLGKVLSLTVFSGNAGLGQLLTGNNSKLITRSINYLIGSPDRKEDYLVDIPDTRINEMASITIKSKSYPKSNITLVKTREDTYEGKYMASETGYEKIIGRLFAVNYPKEYEKLGMNANAVRLTESTGGKVFEKDDTKDIVKFLKTVSKRTKIKKTFVVWPILALIIGIYLFEIMCRKIVENRKRL